MHASTVIAAALFAGLLGSLPPARADDAFMNNGAYGPEPRGAIRGEESIVRMESEQVTIKFGREQSTVAARFVFRSAKPRADARQLLGFPDPGAAHQEAERRRARGEKVGESSDGFSGPLEDVHTLVDGREVASELQYSYIRQDQTAVWKPATPTTGVLMAWHTAWVTFPPAQPVAVERRYRAANGGSVYGVSTFQYITATGAGWRGTIGRLDADVTLEGWTVKDLAWKLAGNPATLPKDQPWCVPDRSGWQILSPTHLHLTWKDFEPRTDVARDEFSLATLVRDVSSGR